MIPENKDIHLELLLGSGISRNLVTSFSNHLQRSKTNLNNLEYQGIICPFTNNMNLQWKGTINVHSIKLLSMKTSILLPLGINKQPLLINIFDLKAETIILPENLISMNLIRDIHEIEKNYIWKQKYQEEDNLEECLQTRDTISGGFPHHSSVLNSTEKYQKSDKNIPNIQVRVWV